MFVCLGGRAGGHLVQAQIREKPQAAKREKGRKDNCWQDCQLTFFYICTFLIV